MTTMSRQQTAAFVAGIVFTLGLGLGGMTDPLKVLSFLDVTGSWDPSLAFVMGGAIAIYAPVFWLVTKRKNPLFADRWYLPAKQGIDTRLVIGAMAFGIGWGLSGFCPGPAVVSLMSAGSSALVFGGSMLIGMVVFEVWNARSAGISTPRPPDAEPTVPLE
jgi:uncharacterized membrane protein YedE/YeeE